MRPTYTTASEDEIISASEIGQWTYCHRAWYLARTGAENRNTRALARGERAHARHSRTVARSHALRWIAILLILLAVLLLAFAIFVGGGLF